MAKEVGALTAFADKAKADGIKHVVLLGMGGSSLAPEVFQQTFGNASGYPELHVLDSTHPAAVKAVEARVDLAHTLIPRVEQVGDDDRDQFFLLLFLG